MRPWQVHEYPKTFSENIFGVEFQDDMKWNTDVFRAYVIIHSGYKSNKCNQCDFASSQAGNLRTHLKMHSGEKPLKCICCYQASYRANNLRVHLTLHSGEKSNKCNRCDYTSFIKDFWRFIWTHTVEKSQTTACNVTKSKCLAKQDLVQSTKNCWEIEDISRTVGQRTIWMWALPTVGAQMPLQITILNVSVVTDAASLFSLWGNWMCAFAVM